MNGKKNLRSFIKQRRGIVALEAAIILIAFVIIAGVFSYMVIDQGLFASNQSKSVIQQSLTQASSSLAVDGDIYVKASADGSNITGIVIPLKAVGVNTVTLGTNTTQVTFDANGVITTDIYSGVQALTSTTYDALLTSTTADKAAMYVPNGATLNANSEGYLVISLSNANGALAGSQVDIKVTLEQTASATIQFTVPSSLTSSGWVTV